MKIDRLALIESLDMVAPALGTNVLVPAFQCFQFDGHKISATDGATVIRTECGIDTGLSCVVPAPQFLSLLKSLTCKEIEIEESKTNIVVKTVRGTVKGTFTTVVKVAPLPIPDCAMIQGGEFSVFMDALNFCRYNVSKDEANGPYCGIRIDGNTAYSTDKYRIAKYDLGAKYFDTPITVPIKFVNALLKHRNEVVELGAKDDRFLVAVLTDGTILYSSLLEGVYRDLEEMFPAADSEFTKVEFPELLKDMLDRHIAFLRNIDVTSKLIKVSIADKTCTIVSTDKDLGTLEEELELAASVGNQIEFDINPLFWKDVSQISNEFNYYEGYILFLTDKLTYLCREAVEVK